jgi:adenosine kinase
MSVVYTGAVGEDDLAKQLRAGNLKEGVGSAYYVVEGAQTGACAVVLTGHDRSAELLWVLFVADIGLDRSLVTTLRAAEKFQPSHLSSPSIAPLIEHAKHFYVEGFFLTHGVESTLELAKKAAAAGKVSCALMPPTAQC